jgi:hypothetical protein
MGAGASLQEEGGGVENLRQLTAEQVAAKMLELSGIYEQYKDNFIENNVDGARLLTIQEQDLLKLGIENVLYRKHLWAKLEKVRAECGVGAMDKGGGGTARADGKRGRRREGGGGSTTTSAWGTRRKHGSHASKHAAEFSHSYSRTPRDNVSRTGVYLSAR